MIHEIAPHIYDNTYQRREAGTKDYLLVFAKEKVLLKCCSDTFWIPRIEEVEGEIPYTSDQLQYLFQIDHVGYYLLQAEKTVEFENAFGDDFCFRSISGYRDIQNNKEAFALITAYQLYTWRESNCFCGRCAAPMIDSTQERARVCPKCGYIAYPKISPAVTVAITDGDRILLSRNAHGTFRKFALTAGFVEIGETFEDTVRREVKEEVGLQVKNIRYYKSQPWGIASDIMVGFYADLDGADAVTLQESEIAEAKWFHRDELDANLSLVSLSYEMIDQFRKNDYPK